MNIIIQMAWEEPVIFRRFVADAIGAYIYEQTGKKRFTSQPSVDELSEDKQKKAIIAHLERGVRLLHLSEDSDEMVIELARIDPALKRMLGVVSKQPDFTSNDILHDYFETRGPFMKEERLEFICSSSDIINNPADWFKKNFDSLIAEINPDLLRECYTDNIEHDGVSIEELKPMISISIYAMVYLGYEISEGEGINEENIEARYRKALEERRYTFENIINQIERSGEDPNEFILRLAEEQRLKSMSWEDILDE